MNIPLLLLTMRFDALDIMSIQIDPKYADLQACCACLGFVDEDVYKVDADAPASIRSILRYLRYESTNCDIRRELGNMKILVSDLIPLIKVSKSDPVLFDLAVRLMVSLTQPAVVCFRNEIPSDRDLYAAFMMVDSILKSYKQAFADEDLFRILAERVEEVFNKDWDERSDEDRSMIERILILVRNVLHISPDRLTEHRTDEDVSIHDQLLWTIHLSGWDDILLFLANSQDERGVFAFHILEIVSLMLREQTPEQLALAGKKAEIDNPNSRILERIHLREQEQKRAALAELNMRHNRFGGTFELIGTQSISSRPLIYHHDVTAPLRRSHLNSGKNQTSILAIGQVDLNLGKRIRRKAVNRKPLIEREYHRRSVLSIQLFLQKFCWEFLQNCYNLLMASARSAIMRQSTQANDETYYLWAMHFFMAFCRLYRFRPQYLSESLNVSVFNWVYTLSMGYREALLTDKRGGARNQNALQSSRRLALVVSAYKEFLLCLQEMLRESSKKVELNIEEDEPETLEAKEQRLKSQKQVAESLMANIFYVAEYQDLLVYLLREYNESLQSKEYLLDLVEVTHLFISLLGVQSKNATTLIVSRRQKRRQRSEKRRRECAAHKQKQKEMLAARKRLLDRANETPEERTARLTRVWTTLSTNLLSALLGNLELPQSEELPELFDPTMMVESGSEAMAIQLRNAIRLVHSALHENQAARALALARKMWDIWPEAAPSNEEENEVEDEDGVEDLARERMKAAQAGLESSKVAEYTALRKIFVLDLAAEELEATESALREETTWIEEDEENLIRRELLDSDDDEERELDVVEREVAFDINSFLLRFTHPHIIRSFTLLLANYALNPPSTNSHLIQLLHKIVVKQNLPGVLFQLRLFQVFQTIVQDPVVGKLDEFKELLRFIKYILRKFFTAFERSRAVVVEALFFKSTREAAEAYSGYGTYESGPKTSNWSPELDKELDQLFEAFRYDPVPKGEDLVDVLKRNLSDPAKTRRQIIMRLMYLGKVSSAKNLKMMTIHAGDESGTIRRSRSRRPGWTEEETSHLKVLFQEYEGSEYRFEDVMTELKLEHERKLKEYEQFQHHDESGTTQPPILRNRQEVRKKLYELGLVEQARDFGKIKRNRTSKKPDSDFDELEGGIFKEKTTKARKSGRRKRKQVSDDEELVYVMSDSEAPPHRTVEQVTSREISVENKETAGEVTGERQRRSLYYDPDESSNEDSVESSSSSEESSDNDTDEDGRKSISRPAIRLKRRTMGRSVAVNRVVGADDPASVDLDDEIDDKILNRELESALAEITTQEGTTIQSAGEEPHPKKRRKVIAFRDEDDDDTDDGSNDKVDANRVDETSDVSERAVSPAAFSSQPQLSVHIEDDTEDFRHSQARERRKVILEDEDEERIDSEVPKENLTNGTTTPLLSSGFESGVQNEYNTEGLGERVTVTAEDENNVNDEQINEADIEVPADDTLPEGSVPRHSTRRTRIFDSSDDDD
nr:timeless [Hymenolepis microstoma]